MMSAKGEMEKMEEIIKEFEEKCEIDKNASEEDGKKYYDGKKEGLEMIKSLIKDKEKINELYRKISDDFIQDGKKVRVKESGEIAKVSKGQIRDDGTKEYIVDHIDKEWSCWMDEDEFEVIK